LQALAREGVLERDVTLMSAVSGGSYIAASYLLVAAPPGEAAEAGGGPGAQQVPLADVYSPGSPEERHLRQHTHYLLPNAASGLRAALCIIFGLALNLSLLLSWIVAAVLPIGWWMHWQHVTHVDAAGTLSFSLTRFGARAAPWWVPVALLGVTLLLFAASSSGVSTVHRHRFHPDRSTVCPPAQSCSAVSDEQGWWPRWLSCGGAQRAMWWTFAAAGVTGYLLLAAPWLVVEVFSHAQPGLPSRPVGVGLGSSFIAILGAVRLVLGGLRGDKGSTAAPPAGGQTDTSPSGVTRLASQIPASVRQRLQSLLTPWLGSAIAAAVLVGASLIALREALTGGLGWRQFGTWVAVVLYLVAARFAVDVNRTSLHSLYRDRLADAFAVRRGGVSSVQPAGQARLSQLTPHFGEPGSPELVVCATANITASGEVPAGRNGVSFTFTQRDAGLERPLSQLHVRPESDALYRRVPTEDYERAVGLRHLSLLDIVAISGAAVSPVMGNSTRVAERFLLALANVRLGVWLPHPALMPVWSEPDQKFSAPKWPARHIKEGAPARPALGTQPAPAVPADPVERQMLRALTGRRARTLAKLLARRLKLAAEEEQQLAVLERQFADEQPTRGAAPTPRDPDSDPGSADVPVDTAEATAARTAKQRTPLWPRLANELRWRGRQPNLRLLLVEALGRTSLSNHWLYVTDGGHYDNLGLVEALRRRPHEVFVFDASGDRAGTWAALGEAVGLARAELGVTITIEPSEMVGTTGETLTPYVLGSYRYRDEEADTPPHPLWLCKLGVPKTAPWDVRAFALTHPTFPTDSTLKQLYDGREFEAYRALGDHSATQLLKKRYQNTRACPTATGAKPVHVAGLRIQYLDDEDLTLMSLAQRVSDLQTLVAVLTLTPGPHSPADYLALGGIRVPLTSMSYNSPLEVCIAVTGVMGSLTLAGHRLLTLFDRVQQSRASLATASLAVQQQGLQADAIRLVRADMTSGMSPEVPSSLIEQAVQSAVNAVTSMASVSLTLGDGGALAVH